MNHPFLYVFLVLGCILLAVAIIMRVNRVRHPEDRRPHPLEIGHWLAGMISCAVGLIPLLGGGPNEPIISDSPTHSPSRSVLVQGGHVATSPGTGAENSADSGPAPSETSESGSYRLEHSGIPLTIRSAHDGRTCSPYIAVDFDGSPTGGDNPITRRVTNASELSQAQRDAIDMVYETCADANLIVRQNTSVGLLRKGAEAGPEQCAAAASAASLGSLNIEKGAGAEEVGFEVGAALCAITQTGRVARATITNIAYNAGIGNTIPTVEFELTTWVRE
ncbi:MAG: hypothetical protein IRY84_01200 [Thermobispora bispora]|jgi:hypothetical protein|uniref:Uncharacterized protein n=1 Tax=Thermobispora bispora (strain ATCC 19993 / DSM 43833 / CBS 139.67 / JCM 10125 / KCTC 9307 / NBRC 14880 / R51) TaxID=469371 RepID=D6Y845_THEBD|nr:hypothetical protein [Thermobispora bispora]ADG89781.1 hypothetical protein Tbis_3086 [Thermobispora bispora DSM 43833]MBX6166253.1 hypothetical protein [Thermobispora bispora]